MVNPGVFPGKRVDVVVVKLGVLGVEFVVVDAPGVVLVEGGGEGKVGGEVEYGGFEAFATELLLLQGGSGGEGGEGLLEVGRGKVRGICEGCVELLEVGGGGGGFGAADPNVVGDATEDAVPGNCQIVSGNSSHSLRIFYPLRSHYAYPHGLMEMACFTYVVSLSRELAYLSSMLKTVPNRYSK